MDPVYSDISHALQGKSYEGSDGHEYTFLSLQETPRGWKFCFSVDSRGSADFSLEELADLQRIVGVRKRIG
jgi:hypothetical protein